MYTRRKERNSIRASSARCFSLKKKKGRWGGDGESNLKPVLGYGLQNKLCLRGGANSLGQSFAHAALRLQPSSPFLPPRNPAHSHRGRSQALPCGEPPLSPGRLRGHVCDPSSSHWPGFHLYPGP